MKLYILHYKGELTHDEASIVTIHRTLEGAEKEMDVILKSYNQKGHMPEYFITEIDTDTIDSDIIYDYEDYND